MRLLFLDAYFEPEEIAYTHLEHDLLETLTAEGAEIDVICPTPTRGISAETAAAYRGRKHDTAYGGHVHITRFAAPREGSGGAVRALRYLWCNLRSWQLGRRARQADAVFCNSTPPTQGLLAARVAKSLSRKRGRRVPFVYNLQDIFPDSLVTTGMGSEGGLAWKIGRRIEAATYRGADRIIVISEGFRRNILAKGVPDEKITVVSNWVDLDEVRPVPRAENRLFEEFGLSRDAFTVVYAGNLGEAQGGDVILDAAERLAEEKDIRFVIFGGGARYEAIRQRAQGMANVTVTGLMPRERVPEVYSLGDVALITCRKGTGNAGLPSKTWSIMACNTPIIASFDTDSDLADAVRASGAGQCVPPEDGEALADAILEAFRARQRGEKPAADLRAYAMETASREACVRKYIDRLREAAGEARE